MPELPEVETVVRDLRPLLAGRTIISVRHSKKKLRRPWKADWNAAVSEATISGVRRRGKWILVDLQRTQIESPPTRRSKTRSDLPHKGGCSEITSPRPVNENAAGRVLIWEVGEVAAKRRVGEVNTGRSPFLIRSPRLQTRRNRCRVHIISVAASLTFHQETTNGRVHTA
ncbi:MAG: DNA-formamidopyrimidine glycosylase family protein [Gemmataceae bacterium]